LKEKEHTEWSYTEFLDLHRSIILDSNPLSGDWSVLDITWARRFLMEARKSKEIEEHDFTALEARVMYLFISQ